MAARSPWASLDSSLCMRSLLGTLALSSLAATAHAGMPSFASALEPPTGNRPRSVAVGDLNGDGFPDLAVAPDNAFGVSVVLSNGAHPYYPIFYGFQPYYREYGYVRQPNSVAIADLNGDGAADLVTAGNFGVTSLLGYGGGAFQDAVFYGVTSNDASGLAIGDFNADGRPDAVVANGRSNTVSVLLGNGDGTFQPQADYPAGPSVWSVATGDVNGDGRPDLVVGDTPVFQSGPNIPPYDGGEISVLLGNGDGTFAPRTAFATGQDPYSVALGDLNGDGKLDAVTADYGAYGYGNSVSTLLGNGDGTFTYHGGYAAGVASPSSVAIADFDRDGFPDVAVGSGTALYSSAPGYKQFSVLPGIGGGSLAAPGFYPTEFPVEWVCAADFNLDGMPDLAGTSATGSVTQVLINVGTPVSTLVADFDAAPASEGIALQWTLGDASLAMSVAVERSGFAVGPWETIRPELHRDGEAMAAVDRTAEAGHTYFYRLDVRLAGGGTVSFGPVSSTATASIAASAVTRVAPNPARAASRIQYSIARAGHVRLEVTDAAGRLVSTLFDGTRSPGRFEQVWDRASSGVRLPAGLYFLRLTAPDRVVAEKIARIW